MLINSAKGRLGIFEQVGFVRVSHNLHGEGGVQNLSEHSYGKGAVLYLCVGFEDPEFVDDSFCRLSPLFHSFKFVKGFFDLVFFSKILVEVVSEFFDGGSGYVFVIVTGEVGNIELLPRVGFSSVNVRENEYSLCFISSEVFVV